MTDFKFPRADQRVVVIGANGTGKTVFGAWIMSHARFDQRPWVILDYKGEELWNIAPDGLIRDLKLGSMPGKRGLYIVSIRPGQEEETEAWLWKIWERGNIGLFVDEATLLPSKHAFKAILRQGRSKRLPVIACTQRPVDIDREVFTEANFVSLFRLQDERDYKTVEFFTGMKDLRAHQLPPHWSRWYSGNDNTLLMLKPCPEPKKIIDRLRSVVPYSTSLFGPHFA